MTDDADADAVADADADADAEADADADAVADADAKADADADGDADADEDADANADLAWETLDTELEYTCPGFDVRRDDVRLPDGTETEFHYVDEPETVVVLPFTTGGDVVLVEEWRQAVDRTNRGLPAGTVEDHDVDRTTAARRELREETGHEAETIEHLQSVEPANGFANSVHHYFVARGCEPTAETAYDFDESIRPVTVDYDQFRQAVFSGDVRDGRAVLGVSMYETGGV